MATHRPRDTTQTLAEWIRDENDKPNYQELEAELRRLYTKLDEGTLHVVYCNGRPDARVGAEGLICNCTLGREIKMLRKWLKEYGAHRLSCPKAHDICDGWGFTCNCGLDKVFTMDFGPYHPTKES